MAWGILVPATAGLWCALVVLGLGLSAREADAWRWGRWRLQLKLQLHMEFDDNVRRLTVSRPDSFGTVYTWLRPVGERINSVLSPLAIERDGVNKWAALVRTGYRSRRHILQAWYGIGLKHFFWITDEDTVNNRGSLLYYYRVLPRLLIGVQGQAGDRRRANQEREYSYANGTFRLLWLAPKGWRLRFVGGYGLFSYRNLENFPDAHLDGISDGSRYSYHGDQFQLQLDKRFGRVWRTSLAYRLSHQFYKFRYARQGDQVVGTLEDRVDWFHNATFSLRFLYVVLVEASYRFELLQSESTGESFLGHRVQLLFATNIFWRMYLVLQAQLQFRTYSDGFTLNHSLFPVNDLPSEDENLASHFSIRLSRTLWRNIQVQLRYSLYINLFGVSAARYLRNLVSVGLTVRY